MIRPLINACLSSSDLNGGYIFRLPSFIFISWLFFNKWWGVTSAVTGRSFSFASLISSTLFLEETCWTWYLVLYLFTKSKSLFTISNSSFSWIVINSEVLWGGAISPGFVWQFFSQCWKIAAFNWAIFLKAISERSSSISVFPSSEKIVTPSSTN